MDKTDTHYRNMKLLLQKPIILIKNIDRYT